MTTTIVLIRHAQPVRAGDDSDFTRPLSETGRRVQRRMNQLLRHRLLVPDAIWHSPVKRAEETAILIGQDFHVVPAVELSLGEFFDEEDLISKFPPPHEKLSIFLVGHGPSLMRFASYLVGEPCYPASPTNSSALQIDFNEPISPGKGQMVRYYSPEFDLPSFDER